jgi:hypothetical protein
VTAGWLGVILITTLVSACNMQVGGTASPTATSAATDPPATATATATATDTSTSTGTSSSPADTSSSPPDTSSSPPDTSSSPPDTSTSTQTAAPTASSVPLPTPTPTPTPTVAPTPAPSLAPGPTSRPTFYVSPNGSDGNGLSWATAWTNTSQIDWSVVPAGATIVLDGGTSTCSVSPYDFQPSSPDPGVTCGQRYAPFTVGQNDVTIVRSNASGHNGTVVIDGGRDTPLPYCGQASYSAPTGASYGIDLGSHTGVTIDGDARSGIIVRGAQNGVRMGPGGHDTLRNMELFDNGFPTTHSYGYNSDGNGILIGGEDNVYDRLLVHDNGQDEFHSDASGYSEAGSIIENSWMGAMRENPMYPGEPFNDLQASGHDPGCTHADGIQIFAPGITMSGLIIDHDVFGPGTNQGLYPSDGGTGATFDNVTVTNTLFLDTASHNIITDNAVHGWTFDHDTIFATQGGSEIPSNGVNTITNTIKVGGYLTVGGGSWNTGANVWFNGDPLPGTATNLNPDFASVPSGTLPSLSSLRAADLTPSCSACGGAPLHSWTDILTWIDFLNAASA